MPVLHQYVSGDGHYAKAWINGSIVTVQITDEGLARLEEESIADGEKFPLALLIDLLATGLAYTGGGGSADKVDYHEAEQFVFGFEENTSAEKDLPVCEESGRFGDLHLVTHQGKTHTQLLAPEAASLCKEVTLSIPLDLLSGRVLDRLLAADRVDVDAPCITTLRDFFERHRGDAWVEHRCALGQQEQLELDDTDQLALA